MATSIDIPDYTVAIPPMTCRDRIMYRILQTIADIPNPYSTVGDSNASHGDLFNEVVFGDTVAVPAEVNPVVGIVEMEETPIALLFPYVDKELRISVEFRWLPDKKDVDTFRLFRYYLAQLTSRLTGKSDEVQRMPTADHPEGLTIGVREDGNFPQIEGAEEEAPSGVLNLIVTYRHVNGDPYKFHPND
jgi:hypothetical protein